MFAKHRNFVKNQLKTLKQLEVIENLLRTHYQCVEMLQKEELYH